VASQNEARRDCDNVSHPGTKCEGTVTPCHVPGRGEGEGKGDVMSHPRTRQGGGERRHDVASQDEARGGERRHRVASQAEARREEGNGDIVSRPRPRQGEGNGNVMSRPRTRQRGGERRHHVALPLAFVVLAVAGCEGQTVDTAVRFTVCHGAAESNTAPAPVTPVTEIPREKPYP